VGWDAEIFAARRAAMSDEEYIALGKTESDEALLEEFERHWGIDIRVSDGSR
jgi:hypothetical protein